MADKDMEVQGAALYLEFRRTGATCQIILMPDGIDSKGEVAWSKFFRRVIRPEAPKKRWAAYGLVPSSAKRDEIARNILAGTDVLDWNDLANERLRHTSDYFDSLIRGGYLLVNDKPLYVEVSKADLDEAKTGSLSTKVWNRVKASRIAAGFPVSLTD